MDFQNHVNLLRKYRLIKKTRDTIPALKNVINSCLAPGKEKILIVTDTGEGKNRAASMIGAGYYMAAKELGLDVHFVSQRPKTSMDRADTDVEERINRLEEGNIIILCVSNKLGETNITGKSFRRFSKKRNHKFISATGLGTIPNEIFGHLLNPINIDYKKLREEQLRTKDILDNAREIYVTTKAGTDVRMKVRKGKTVSNDGNYTIRGTGGNVPAGEVYIPPVKDKSEGVIVVDGSSRNEFGTWLVKNPFKMMVEKGDVVSIEGGKEAKLLEASLLLAEGKAKYPERVRRLAEFGIGFNPTAQIIGSTIIDEKTRGTCHFAIGSNYWFGGDNRTIVHFDQVVKNPRIEIDGNLLKLTRI